MRYVQSKKKRLEGVSARDIIFENWEGSRRKTSNKMTCFCLLDTTLVIVSTQNERERLLETVPAR